MAARAILEAEKVLQDCGQASALPIDLTKVHLGERLVVKTFRSRKRVEGRFELVQGMPTIFLNTTHGPLNDPRVRFVFSHELGHFFLHRSLIRSGQALHDAVIRFGDSALSEIEREANEFAGELLLPGKLLKKALASQLISCEFLSSLALSARMSVQACAIRCAQFTEARCCFFFQGHDGVIEWTAPSPSWREARMNSSSWRNQYPPAGSLSHSKRQGFSTEEVARSVWCPNTWNLEDPLFESALWLGQYGQLILVLDTTGIDSGY